ncbi:LOW QUALITY PROTEIN: coiled-coil domain-containing protein 103-like [Gigantopelta aegis]|uniref:LOW QUALITY PROTEIN: coiled-coil domain-containing protein 103-like n=1 Tax=Gigantopelta aegis TaxID=1735272 RepID=UPI001B889BBA|nr:LOW QUALITY PROTEIN: coiled-coil domain-containing protein 103-like [Gigantopelta aegis]
MSTPSHDDNDFDFDKLERELNAAVIADEQYNRENDAKFRAVHQRVATYEEFKDIVAASHLKPLDKGDKINSHFKQPWNMLASQGKTDTLTNSTPLTQSKELRIPETSLVFIREWRHVHKTVTERYDFLLAIGATRLVDIFRGEIGFGLLGDFLLVLLNGTESDSSQVVEILEQLSTTNRFSLTVQFLSKTEKDECRKLLAKLKADNADSVDILDKIEKLKVIYEVKE